MTRLAAQVPAPWELSFIDFIGAAAILAYISFPTRPFTCIAFGARWT
jgi:hypothetical protein